MAARRSVAASAALALHGAILLALLAPRTLDSPIVDARAASPPLIASVRIAVSNSVDSGVPLPLVSDLPAPILAITLPTLPPPAAEAVVTDAFETAHEAESTADTTELARLQGVYVGQIRGRLSRVLEMAVAASPIESGRCEVQVIQNERGEVLDVDLVACTFDAGRKLLLASAIRRASPLPSPPTGLAMGSSLTLDLSGY